VRNRVIGLGSCERCGTAPVKSYVDERNAFAWRPFLYAVA